MVNWSDPAIVAALISATISLIGLIVTNIYQSAERERFERRRALRDWYNDVLAASRGLKAATTQIRADSSLEWEGTTFDKGNSSREIENVIDYIDDLQEIANSAPTDVQGRDTTAEIKALVGRCVNPKGGPNPLSSSLDLKEIAYEHSYKIEKYAKDEKEDVLAENRSFFNNLLRG